MVILLPAKSLIKLFLYFLYFFARARISGVGDVRGKRGESVEKEYIRNKEIVISYIYSLFPDLLHTTHYGIAP